MKTVEPIVPRAGLYLCWRTSTHDVKPCEEAFKVAIRRNLAVVEVVWAVEVSDMQEFVEKYGDCVVGRSSKNGFCTIEIYDDYRE